MRQELMPQIHQFLAEWTDRQGKPVSEPVVAAAHLSGKVPHTPRPIQPRQYASREEMRTSMLPCPSCLKLGRSPPGAFVRDECMLSFFAVNSETNTKGTLFCFTCKTNVKIKEVLKRPIFLSYNWGNDLSTQKIARPLCERILEVTEMPYWLDIDGGMGFGDELVTEMREGVAACEIVVLMISDAFVNSDNCLREFIHMCNHHKYIIPILVPNFGPTRCGPSGWTGVYEAGDEDWWKHAERICTSKDPDAPEEVIDWSYLSAFNPIDLREIKLEEDGSLPVNSEAENMIISRIVSRFFR